MVYNFCEWSGMRVKLPGLAGQKPASVIIFDFGAQLECELPSTSSQSESILPNLDFIDDFTIFYIHEFISEFIGHEMLHMNR